MAETLEELQARHRKEAKEAQGQAMRLKKAAGSNKKARKSAVQQGEALVVQLEDRHAKELKAFKEKIKSTTEGDGENMAHAEGEAVAAGTEAEAAAQAPTTEPRVTEEPAAPVQKKSKAQKRREKKEREARERQARIDAAEPAEGESAREMEEAGINAQIQPKGLRIHQIRPDGHCLFASVAIQIEGKSADALRKASTDYVRKHPEDFCPFLTNDSGDPMSPAEFEAYCEKMETTAAWGGQCEIKALSEILKAPITVFQATGPVQTIGEHFASDAILLSYHRHQFGLGEHYNAVVMSAPEPVSEPELR